MFEFVLTLLEWKMVIDREALNKLSEWSPVLVSLWCSKLNSPLASLCEFCRVFTSHSFVLRLWRLLTLRWFIPFEVQLPIFPLQLQISFFNSAVPSPNSSALAVKTSAATLVLLVIGRPHWLLRASLNTSSRHYLLYWFFIFKLFLKWKMVWNFKWTQSLRII